MGVLRRLRTGVPSGWRKSLENVMESTSVNTAVIVLIIIDVSCTAVNDVLENTDLLNPKYQEEGERVSHATYATCIVVLSLFLLEQLLRIVASGYEFFTHPWYVMDLVVVVVSLVCETVLHPYFHDADWIAMLVILRLWKVVAVIFDLFLASHEAEEARAKEREQLIA
uniref:Voltage-gated hydrogen channel 1 n=1 Tax=Pyrodinium bahamense TaxID=73915 RepID=A0A7S0A7E8_9DINO